MYLATQLAREATRAVSVRLSNAVNGMIPILPLSNPVRRSVKQEMLEIEHRASRPITTALRQPLESSNREVVVPNEIPPELQHLQECQTYGIPVSVVMARDSVLLPFELEDNMGIVYLGFFKIQGSQVRTV
jgi:hypothetical protein